jgi:hypothetical protein
MANFSKKMGGKEVGDASVYAQPHTMDGKPLTKTRQKDPNTLSALESGVRSSSKRVSDGDPGADNVKTDGIKIRGTGAATKGFMARGPMA